MWWKEKDMMVRRQDSSMLGWMGGWKGLDGNDGLGRIEVSI